MFVLEASPVGAKTSEEKLAPANAVLLLEEGRESTAWKLVVWECGVVQPAVDSDDQ
jgi:hypothetical protein